jgi:protein tyrosine/serine phosphatase
MKWVKRTGAGLGVLLFMMGLYVGIQYLTGNFHEVIAGQFYRSGQLSAATLGDEVRRYGIKTVINLRGSSSRQWYTDEVAESTRLGIKHIDFKMSATRLLPLDRVKTLIALMRDAPKPLLIHCQGGSDRSGLAAAIYMNLIAGQNEDLAELQLSPLFGHFGIPYVTGTYEMDKTWENLEVAYHIEG